jgi:hypothetical protein
MNTMPGSEIAQLRQKIADEYIAATRGLSGLAYGTIKHQFITHRMNAMGEHAERLKELVGEEEAGRIFVEVLEEV